MREGMFQPRQRLLNATGKVWRLERDKEIESFVASTMNAHSFF